MATPELRHMLRDDDLNHEEQKQVLELAIKFHNDRFYHQPFAGPGESGISSGDTCVESVACAWNQSAICVSLTGCRFHASSPTLRASWRAPSGDSWCV